MKTLIVFTCLITLGFNSWAQLTDSNLPIVIIQTVDGLEIPDMPRTLATMKIIYSGPGERNYVIDQADPTKLNYDGKIQIETRGSSSQILSKKQYGLTTVMEDNVTNNNVSLLGMPQEHDWTLNSFAYDASYLRDYLCYGLSRKIGQYAPRQEYCEVTVNGEYRGLYVLQEKIKIDKNRVDIVKMDPTDNSLPDLSGGYIVKADKITWEDVSAWTMSTYLGTNTDFVHESPKSSDITTGQHSYIKSVFDQLAQTSNSASVTSGFPSVIDVPSFVDFMLLNEISSNVDAYQFSTFFHKDKNGKLRAGPLWDLNLTFGNDLTFWGLDRSQNYVWQFDNNDNVGPMFWKNLFSNSTFKCYLARRWDQLTNAGQPFDKNSINAFIDETVTYISEGVARDRAYWGIFTAHSSEISNMKNWISQREAWMDSNLGSFGACASVYTPPLVISRIDYHPLATAEFPDETDQEFIEIVNAGSEPVNLSGLYFSGPGFVYQFPLGQALPPNGSIQLSNRKETFNQKYGYLPYGQFTRNLSNDSQTLTLADAFGNVVDLVEYSDSEPWPQADGNGMYIKLKDVTLDNNVGSNWIAVNEELTGVGVTVSAEEFEDANIEIYPNPTDGIINISSNVKITGIEVRDVQGRRLEVIGINRESASLNFEKYPGGVYLLTIQTIDKTTIKKVVRK